MVGNRKTSRAFASLALLTSMLVAVAPAAAGAGTSNSAIIAAINAERQVGVDEHAGYTCTTTWPGYTSGQSTRPQVFSYPGNGGNAVPGSETSFELPFTPESVVDLQSTTGFNIMVWATGLNGATIDSASLTGPGGARVALRTIDGSQPTLGDYLGPGAAFLIPMMPLAGATRYDASVRFTDAAGATIGKDWHFTTAPTPIRVGMNLTGGKLIFRNARRNSTRITIVLKGPETRSATLLLHRPRTAVSFFRLFPALTSGRFLCTLTTLGAGSTPTVSSFVVGS